MIVTKEQQSGLFHRYRWPLCFFTVVAAAMLLVNSGSVGRAGLSRFYAGSCLGSWVAPQNATGAPDGASAVLGDSLAEIFCSDFRGDIPPDSEPKVFRVRFAWEITDSDGRTMQSEVGTDSAETVDTNHSNGNNNGKIGDRDEDEIDSPDQTTVIITGGSFDDSVAEIIDLPADVPVEFTLVEEAEAVEEAGVIEEAEEEVSVESAAEVKPTEETFAPAPAVEAETVSWWRRLVGRAFATSTSGASDHLSITAGEIMALAENTVSTGDLLEVFYTLDSRTWRWLGRVTRDNWHEASFDLPLTHWTDLQNLQISVRNLPRVDSPLGVELDSVWLEVDYEDNFGAELSATEIALLPRVVLPAAEVFLSTDHSFRAGETPEFLLRAEFPVFQALEPETKIEQVSEPESESETQSELEPGPELTETEVGEVRTREPDIDLSESSPADETPPVQLLNWIHRQLAPETARASIFTPTTRVIKTSVLDPAGKVIPTQPEIISEDGSIGLSLPNLGRASHPGKYRLEVELLRGRQVLVTSTDFYWGVLAMNANQSVYAPGDLAYLQFAVLDDTGHTICDADLSLSISGPAGRSSFSTEAGTIVRNETCGPNNVTDEPDYFAYLPFSSVGTYELELTNLGNQHQITDYLIVREGDSLVIERVAATRINPFAADYQMRLRLTANDNLDLVKVDVLREAVPIEFQITDAGGGAVTNHGSYQTIEWPVDLTPGQTEEIYYEYHAPPVSPQLYLLGPASLHDDNQASLHDDNQIVFTEERQWQIAADAACTSNVTTGNWSASGSWTNCGGVVPGSADTVTILNGHTITLDANITIRTIDIQNGGTLDTDNNNRVLTLTRQSGSVAFTLGSTGTFTAGNSTVKVHVTAAGATNVTVTSGEITFNNLDLTCNLGISNRTYNFGTATTTVSNNLLVDPTKVGSVDGVTLIVNLGGPLVVSGTTTLTGTNGGLSRLNTNGREFTSGWVDMDAPATLNAGGSLLTLTGTSGTLLTLDGEFNTATSTVRFTPDASVTLNSATSTTYYNLEFTPNLTDNRTYTFGAATTTVNNNLTINPDSNDGALEVRLGAALTVAPTKTLTISQTTDQSIVLDTTSSNHPITAGRIVIDGYATELKANASTITLTGTSGTLFTRDTDSIFTADTSTVIFNGAGSPTLTSGAVTFYNLQTNTSSSTAGCSCVYTFGSGAITVDNVFEINPIGNTVADIELTVRLGSGGLVTNATTTLTATPSTFNASSTLDTTASDYSLTTGSLDIAHASSTLLANDSTVTVNRDWSNSGVFGAGNSTVVFAGSTAGTIDLGGSGTGKQFYNLTINKSGSATTTVITNHLDVANVLTITAGALDIAGRNITTTATINNSSILQLRGDETISATPTNNSGSTVVYTATSGSRAIKNWTYHHLIINGSGGTFSLPSSQTFGGAVSVLAGVLNTANHNATTTSVTIASGATFTAGSSVVALNGTTGTLFTQAGTFNANTSTFDFIPNASLALTSGTTTFYNLRAAPPIISANRVYTFGSDPVNISNDLSIIVTVTALGAPFSLEVLLGADLAVSGVTLLTSSGPGIPILDTVAGQDHALSTGRLNIATGGTLNANGSTITLTGGFFGDPIFTRVGTFNAGTSLVLFQTTSSGSDLTSGSVAFHDLAINPGNLTSSLSRSFGSGAITASGDFTFQASSFDSERSITVSLGATMSIAGTTTISGSNLGQAILDTTASDHAFSSGNLHIADRGTFTANGSAVTLNGTSGILLTHDNGGTFNADWSTLYLVSDADITVVKGSPEGTFLNEVRVETLLTDDRTWLFETTPGGCLVAAIGDVYFNPDSASAHTLNVGFSDCLIFWSNVEVQPQGDALAVIDINGTSFVEFGNLYVATGGSVLSDGDVLVYGDLELDGGSYLGTTGTMIAGGSVIIGASGYFSAPAEVNVQGAGFSNQGTFVHNSGLVELNGANQSLSGSTNFFNFKKSDVSNNSTDLTLTFPSNATTTISGLLTLTGLDANDRVNLVSSSPGTPAGLTVNGTFSLNYLEVTDSDASLGALLIPLNSLDGGGNSNWDFGGLTIMIDSISQVFPKVTPGGATVATSSLISVQTHHPSGFVITVERNNGALPTMRLTADTSITLTDKTAWSPGVATTSAGNATASTTEPQTLQFRVRAIGTDTPNYASTWWGSSDADANALFAGFPSTPQIIVNRSIAATATTTISILYNLAVPVSQPSGDYSGDITYTITTNP